MGLPQLRTIEPENWPGAEPARTEPARITIAPSPAPPPPPRARPAHDPFHAIRFAALLAVMVAAAWVSAKAITWWMTPPAVPEIAHVTDAQALDVLERAGGFPLQTTVRTETEILAVAGILGNEPAGPFVDGRDPGREFDFIAMHAVAIRQAQRRAVLVNVGAWLLVGGMLLTGVGYRPRDSLLFLVPLVNAAVATKLIWRLASTTRYWTRRPY